MPQVCFFCSAKAGLHKMPVAAELRAKWLAVLPISSESVIKPSFRVCSTHFNQNCLTNRGRLVLNAVPSKFPTRFDEPMKEEYFNVEPNITLKRTVVDEISSSNSINPQPSSSTAEHNKSANSACLGSIARPRPIFRDAGDIDETADYSPRTSKRALKKCKEIIASERKKRCALNRKFRRMEEKIKTIDSFLQTLIDRGITCGDSLDEM